MADVSDINEAYKFAARVSACPGPGGKPLNFRLKSGRWAKRRVSD